MASYTTDDLFPEGGGYKAGDTCKSLNPDAVVPRWIYTGLQWVPDSVNADVNELTGGNRFIEALVRQLDGIISGEITRDANGAATSAQVVFPDGVTGTYTALVLSAAFPGAVDSYSVTYGNQTYTQPTVTRDASGAVINRPEFVVS